MFMFKPNVLAMVNKQRSSMAIRQYSKQLPKLSTYIPKRSIFLTPAVRNLQKKSIIPEKAPFRVDLSDKEYEEIFGGQKQQQLVKGFDHESAVKIKKNQRPIDCDVKVAYWLFFVASLVFSIIIIGGLTRLTESGLSITEWKPITGAIPPLTQADWEEEFNKYKESPEFKQLNSHMNLDDFQVHLLLRMGPQIARQNHWYCLCCSYVLFLIQQKIHI
ncbi:unnamed protein product [Hanseniaspora opuntiae]